MHVHVIDCANSESISGTVADIRAIDDIQDKKYSLTEYQKKAFKEGDYVYFLRLKNTIKMDRLYFNSFYIVSTEPLALGDIQNKSITVAYRRRCLKNIFYSTGLEGRRYADSTKAKGLLFIDSIPVLKVESITIIQ